MAYFLRMPLKSFCQVFKYFLTILLFISTCTVVAHSVLAYQFNAVQTLVDEKEASDSKSTSTDVKDYSKEKIISFSNTFLPFSIETIRKAPLADFSKCSKGFFNQLYNPPEAI